MISLLKLIESIVGETGDVKRRNKEKKNMAGLDLPVTGPGSIWRPDPRATKPELRAYQQDPEAYWKSKNMGTGQHPNDDDSGYPPEWPTPPGRHTPKLPRTTPAAWAHRGKSPVAPGPEGRPRVPVNSPAPQDVRNKVLAGGEIKVGKYYDAQGNYLGKSQGGQWLANKQTYAPDDSKLEMYQKIKEIESMGYKVSDKELVKEMIRELMRKHR